MRHGTWALYGRYSMGGAWSEWALVACDFTFGEANTIMRELARLMNQHMPAEYEARAIFGCA